MHIRNKNIIIALLAFVFIAFSYDSSALPANWSKKDGKADETTQRARVHNGFDNQPNTVSNIQFYTSNYGIFGQNVAQNVGGGYWPRGSVNQYIFGGGIWFGTIKPLANTQGEKGKFVVVSYDPNNGQSWLTPGTVYDEDGNFAPKYDATKVGQYKVYTSTDFDRTTGEPMSTLDGYNWPIWDTETDTGYILKYDRYFGRYVPKQSDRNIDRYPRGPAFISGEDIYSVYKDTDLKQYTGGEYKAKQRGYPLTLQFEQMIYSWGFGMYKDFIFMKYDIINFSQDTLYECWMAPMLDVDIAVAPYTTAGADNDRTKWYDCNNGDTLNMAFQWTEGNQREAGKGFGYLGYDFLESPSIYKAEGTEKIIVDGQEVEKSFMCSDYIDLKAGEINPKNNQAVPNDTSICIEKLYFDKWQEGFVRKDKRYYANRFQLGLKTMKNWNIEEDMKDEDARYDGMSSLVRDGDKGAGDKRFMMATGPFSVLPKDTVRVVVGIIIANAAVKKECDGSCDDAAELVKKDMFAQSVYDNNFRAPEPPAPSKFLWYKSYNNAIQVEWDSSAEKGNDKEEKGMDFMGYTLYRARNPYLDTFAMVSIPAGVDGYTNGRGPYGWKKLASWQIPTPFVKSGKKAGTTNASNMPNIDEFMIVGKQFLTDVPDGQTVIDTMAIKVIRVPKGIKMQLTQLGDGTIVPRITGFDTSLTTGPWDKLFKKLNDLPDNNGQGYVFDVNQNGKTGYYMLDSVMVGYIKLNPALLSYNPLYWRKKLVPWDNAITDSTTVKDSLNVVHLYGTRHTIAVNDVEKEYYYQMVPLFNKNSSVKDWDVAFKDFNHLNQALDSLYYYIQNGMVQPPEFPDFESYSIAKDSVIVPYMKSITNGRKYFDWGEENGNAIIDLYDESTRTEKIINNVEYYYKLEAWDEGDYFQPTEMKSNNGSVGLSNNILTYAKAGRPYDNSKFEIEYIDQDKIGGLSNFEFFAVDNERVNQKLLGRTLELEFQPEWNLYKIQGDAEKDSKVTFSVGLYDKKMTVRDAETKEVLFEGNTFFERPSGEKNLYEAPTENAFSIVRCDKPYADKSGDTIRFGMPENNEKIYRYGEITTADFKTEYYAYSYDFKNGYENTFGFKFTYAYEQRGGIYRPESAAIVKGNATTPFKYFSILDMNDEVKYPELFPRTQFVESYNLQIAGTDVIPDKKYGSFNNGPGEYLVTFTEGGTEQMTLSWINDDETKKRTATFNVPYLKYNIVNQYSYKYKDVNDQEKTVKYGQPLEYMELPNSAQMDSTYNFTTQAMTQGELITCPSHLNLKGRYNEFIGKYNTFSVAYVKNVPVAGIKAYRSQIAVKEGSLGGEDIKADKMYSVGQGKYYLSTVNESNDSLCFMNVINIGGQMFVSDHYNRRWVSKKYNPMLPDDQNVTIGQEVKAGDQVLLKTTGGAFGLPMPGAKVRCKVVNAAPANNEYSESQLDKIKIVPNPYYITTEVQPNPFQAYIYFTKLPAKCTIDIYTVTGDLIRTINHEDASASSQFSDSKYAFDTWDLFSRNGQRVQSQTFIAVISTPNGEQTVQKFSVVVGGTRLITK